MYTLNLVFKTYFKSVFHLVIYISQSIFVYITLIYPLPEILCIYKNQYDHA